MDGKSKDIRQEEEEEIKKEPNNCEENKQNEIQLERLFTDYIDRSYERVASLDYACKVMYENLHFHEYPMLPPLFCWSKAHEGDKEFFAIMKHSSSPCHLKILTFMGKENLGYVVLESFDGTNFRNMYSYARARDPVYSGERKLKYSNQFKGKKSRVSTEAFVYGHCIDFADTPNDAQVDGKLSCNHEANIILEPSCSWGQVRCVVVRDARASKGSYAQFVFYDEDSPISYEYGRYPVSNGVLLFLLKPTRLNPSEELKLSITQAWQISWKSYRDDEVHRGSDATPEGDRRRAGKARIRNYTILLPESGKQNFHLYLAYELRKIPEWMNFTRTRITDSLKDSPVKVLNPMERYCLQLLADSEHIPFHSFSLILCDLLEHRVMSASAWIDRLINYCEFLSENDITDNFIGIEFLQNLSRFHDELANFAEMFQRLVTLGKVFASTSQLKWKNKQLLVKFESRERQPGLGRDTNLLESSEEIVFQYPGAGKVAELFFFGPEHVCRPIRINVKLGEMTEVSKGMKGSVTKWFCRNFLTYPNHQWIEYNLSLCPRLSIFQDKCLISKRLKKKIESLSVVFNNCSLGEESTEMKFLSKPRPVIMATLQERDDSGNCKSLGNMFIHPNRAEDVRDEIYYKSEMLLQKSQAQVKTLAPGAVEIDPKIFQEAAKLIQK